MPDPNPPFDAFSTGRGHLYTCIDMISRRPMLYANPSIESVNIGYLGARAAFGVEFNLPARHRQCGRCDILGHGCRDPESRG